MPGVIFTNYDNDTNTQRLREEDTGWDGRANVRQQAWSTSAPGKEINFRNSFVSRGRPNGYIWKSTKQQTPVKC